MSRTGLRSNEASRRKRLGTPDPIGRVLSRLILAGRQEQGRASPSSPRSQPEPSQRPSGQKSSRIPAPRRYPAPLPAIGEVPDT